MIIIIEKKAASYIEKDVDVEVFVECHSKFKVHIVIGAISEVACIHIGILDHQQRNGHFIAEIVVVVVQLELQLHASSISQTKIFLEIIVGRIQVRLIRLITAGEYVDDKDSLHQLPFFAIVRVLNEKKPE